MKINLKIGTVTTLSDARYCAGMGVEIVGFCIDESSDKFVDFSKFKEITGWLSGIKTVVESRSSDVDFLLNKINEYEQPYFLQIADSQIIDSIKSKNDIAIILTIDIDQDVDTIDHILEQNASKVAFFILESPHNNAALSGDWPMILENWCKKYPIFLGFGITAQNVTEIIENIHPQGIALQGTDEPRPGFKDYGDLMDILEALEDMET